MQSLLQTTGQDKIDDRTAGFTNFIHNFVCVI